MGCHPQLSPLLLPRYAPDLVGAWLVLGYVQHHRRGGGGGSGGDDDERAAAAAAARADADRLLTDTLAPPLAVAALHQARGRRGLKLPPIPKYGQLSRSSAAVEFPIVVWVRSSNHEITVI